MGQADYYRGVEAAQQALARVACDDAAVQAETVHTALGPHLDDTSLARHRACRRGCDHCCHLPVGVTFGEALRLAGAAEHDRELAAQVRAEAEATAALGWSALAGRPCPLLRQGACAAHDARPLPCRALASSDAAACARGLRGLGDVPIDDEAFLRGLGAAEALAAATKPMGTRELRAAVAAVLAAAPSDRAAAFLATSAPPGASRTE